MIFSRQCASIWLEKSAEKVTAASWDVAPV